VVSTYYVDIRNDSDGVGSLAGTEANPFDHATWVAFLASGGGVQADDVFYIKGVRTLSEDVLLFDGYSYGSGIPSIVLRGWGEYWGYAVGAYEWAFVDGIDYWYDTSIVVRDFTSNNQSIYMLKDTEYINCYFKNTVLQAEWYETFHETQLDDHGTYRFYGCTFDCDELEMYAYTYPDYAEYPNRIFYDCLFTGELNNGGETDWYPWRQYQYAFYNCKFTESEEAAFGTGTDGGAFGGGMTVTVDGPGYTSDELCEFSVDVLSGTFPAVALVSSETLLYSDFGLTDTTDETAIARWSIKDYDTDPNGGTRVGVGAFYFAEPDPVLAATASPESGEVPLTVQFSASWE